jgi:hypothetical protein
MRAILLLVLACPALAACATLYSAPYWAYVCHTYPATLCADHREEQR